MRTKTAIPFGGGLDRASGVMTVEPAAFSDLRNVYLHDGRAELRKGLLQKLAYAGATDILGIYAVRTFGLGVVVTYSSSTGTVSLWITAGDASSTAFVGDLPWTFASGSVIPPRISAADSYDVLMIAHDEPNFALRNQTIIYDVGAGSISAFASDTLGTVKFRGVGTYLAYMVGWGHGTPTDSDRGEIVRVSLPAQPTTFDINHYFVAGQRGDAVLRCDPAGDVYTVRKQSESYDIFGYDRATFGIRPSDRLFGVGGSRLGITVGGVNYFWSLDGPRRSSGGASGDLAVLLDLPGAPPDALAATLDLDNGFACYLSPRREVWFVFGQWVFILHVADPSALRWSYRALGVQPRCAGILYDAGVSLFPAAHVEVVSASFPASYQFEVVSEFSVVGGPIEAGELVEYWLKDGVTSVWALYGSVAPDPTTPTQTVIMNGSLHHGTLNDTLSGGLLLAGDILVGVDYDIAARLKKSGVAGAAYTAADPSLWPSTARCVGLNHTLVGDIRAGSYVSADDGFGHQVVTITLTDGPLGDRPVGQSHVSYQMQADFGSGFVDVTALSGATDLANKKVKSIDLTARIGETHNFQVRMVTAFYQGAWSPSLSVTI